LETIFRVKILKFIDVDQGWKEFGPEFRFGKIPNRIRNTPTKKASSLAF
jgi:hypothetical protein